MRRALAFSIIAGLLLWNAVSAQAVGVGDAAPDFQGKTLEGQNFNLADYKGQLILLKIGTTWCPSCREQAKAIDSIHGYLVEKDVKIIDVFIDESESTISKFFSRGKYQEPTAIVLDEGEAQKAYNVYVIPRTILIDKNFEVVRDGGTLSSGSLKKKIEKMLSSD